LQTRGAVVFIAAYTHRGLDVWLDGKQRGFYFEAWADEEVAIAVLIAGLKGAAQIEAKVDGPSLQKVAVDAAGKAFVPGWNGWVVSCVELTVDTKLGLCGTGSEGKQNEKDGRELSSLSNKQGV
jgi:hypothetical protein